jgi:oligoendopeptidase F
MLPTLQIPDWDDLAQTLKHLITQPLTEENVAAWLASWDKVASQVRDTWLTLYRATFLDSSDTELNKLYDDFMRDVLPRFEPLEDDLSRKLISLNSSQTFLKPIVARMTADLQTNHERISHLVAEERILSRAHQELVSKQVVVLGSEPLTLQKAQSNLKTASTTSERKVIWDAIHQVQRHDYTKIDEIALKLFQYRFDIAQGVGCKDYRDYAFLSTYRFDYTPSDALKLVDQISENFSDLQITYASHKTTRLNLESLKPWDAETDLPDDYRARIVTVTDYLESAKDALGLLDPFFKEIVVQMQLRGNIELETKLNRANTNAASYFSTTNHATVFGNLAGHPSDIRIVLHELGHAIHFTRLGPGKSYWTKGATPEVSEFVAYVIQTLGGEKLEQAGFFTPSEMKAYKRFTLEFVLGLFRKVMDAEKFQHWVYQQHPNELTSQRLDDAYLALANPSPINWTGLEPEFSKSWRNRWHTFAMPFNNIEYLISWIAVLHFMRNYRKQPSKAFDQLKEMMLLGRTAGTAESLQKLDIHFPFSDQAIREARDILEEEFFDL